MRDPVRGGQTAAAFEELREVKAALGKAQRRLENRKRQVETLEAERAEFVRRIQALEYERDAALDELRKVAA